MIHVSLRKSTTRYTFRRPVKDHRGVTSLGLVLLLIVLLISSLITHHYIRAPKHRSQSPHAVVQQQVTPPPVPLATKGYGIAAGSSLTGLDDTDLNKRLDGIKKLGATWIRFDFNWALIQQHDAQTYDWSATDRVVSAAMSRHLNVLGIIAYTPAWARPASCDGSMQCAPADSQAFADFAATVAGRYAARGVYYWEIWNEPNSGTFWQPRADPVVYAKLLSRSYTAIKHSAPKASVITGSLAPQPTNGTSFTPIDFLSELYKDGITGHFDAIGMHPYTFPLSPASKADHAWNQMARSSMPSLRAIMVNHGDTAKKIWITEFGAPTGGPGPVATLSNPNLAALPYVVDEALQTKLLEDALTLYRSYSWSGPFFYYSYQDAGTSTATNENFFGLIRYDGTPKPAYAVFQDVASHS